MSNHGTIRSRRFGHALTALTLSSALLAGATGCGSAIGGPDGARGRGGEVFRAVTAAGYAEPSPASEAVQVQAALAQAAALAGAVALPETVGLVEAAIPAQPEPTPTTSAERQKFAKARFVANAGLAAGATYQWIIKPYREGKFKKGAKGRTFTLVKAGLAGAFAYNRLKAAIRNAQGDPLLSKAVAPLTAGVESLKNLGTKLRKGEAGDADISSFEDVINGVKDAGKGAGAPVTDQVPSLSQLGG